MTRSGGGPRKRGAFRRFRPLYARAPGLAVHAEDGLRAAGPERVEGEERRAPVVDLRLMRRAALRRSVAGAEARCLRRWMILARLEHPGLLAVYERGLTLGGEPYLLTRPREGESLAALIARGEDRPALINTLVQVAEAVAYAHERGFIHGRLDAEAVSVERFGETIVDGWQLEAEDCGPADDVRALGALLTEALAGAAPPELRSLARRARAAGRRGFSAASFLAELKAYRAGERLSCHRYGPLALLLRGARSRPSALVAVVLAVLSLAGGALGWRALLDSRAAEERSRLRTAAARRARDAARRQQRDLERAVRRFDEAERLAARRAPAEAIAAAVDEALALGGRSADTLIRAGRIYGDHGYIDQARRLFDRAAARFPEAYDAYYELHRLEVGDDQATRFRITEPIGRLIAAARERGARNEFTLYSQALEANRRRDPAAAEALCRELAGAYPGFASGVDLYGHLLANRGEDRRALALLDRLLEQRPRVVVPRVNRGLLRARTGDPEGALDDYDLALLIEPDNAVALINRGNLLKRLGRDAEAGADYDRSLAVRETAFGYYNRGVFRGGRGDRRGAIADYTAALRLDPRLALAAYNRGNMYGQLGQIEPALADLRRCAELDPSFYTAHHNRGCLLLAQGRNREAAAAFSAALAVNPKYSLSLINRGSARFALGDYAGAAADYDAAIAIGAERSEPYFNRAQARAALGRLDEAIADLDRVLALTPGDHEARLERARLRLKKGQAARARAELEELLKGGPSAAVMKRARALLAQLSGG